MHKSLEFRNKAGQTISISISDLDDTTHNDQDESVASGVAFIKKGVRGGSGGDSNEGLCVEFR